jgi:hypothetical protein
MTIRQRGRDEPTRHTQAPGSVESVGSGYSLVKRGRPASAPAQSRCDVGQNRLDDMGIVGNAQLVRHGQE